MESYCSILEETIASHKLTNDVYSDLQALFRCCVATSSEVRRFASDYISTIVTRFPSLLCETSVVTFLLELLTLLRHSVDSHWIDPYTPTYVFSSVRIALQITLTADFRERQQILSTFYLNVRSWLDASITSTPIELQALLQEYIDSTEQAIFYQQSEMGRSIAMDLMRTSPKGRYLALEQLFT